MTPRLTLAACLAFTLAARTAPAQYRLELEKGDHVCYLGNTLGERMQHDGWLEAVLHYRFPEHNLC